VIRLRGKDILGCFIKKSNHEINKRGFASQAIPPSKTSAQPNNRHAIESI
jgi:hypothetical protein